MLRTPQKIKRKKEEKTKFPEKQKKKEKEPTFAPQKKANAA